jgi:hypothetical protein
MTSAPRGLALPLLAAAAAAIAALTLLLPSQPSYDPWAWLLWGRELAGGDLDTAEGPAFKPLAVAVTTALAAAGDAAPTAWLWVARTGALLAVGLGARVAWRLGGGTLGAGLAAGGVALTAGFVWHGAVGNAEGLTLALGLGAVDRALDGRPRAAIALGAAAALLRPEAFVLVLAAGLWLAPRRSRPALAAAAVLVPLAWVVPEWLGSGDPLRSGARAQVPNPGQPATAAVPALASLEAALGLVLAPLLLAAAAAAAWAGGAVRRVALLGAAWLAEVALMAQLAGTSGEPRYALPGAALLAVAGAAALPLLPRPALVRAAAALVAVAAVLRLDAVEAELRRAGDEAELYAALPRPSPGRAAAGRLAVRGAGHGPLPGPRRGVRPRRPQAGRALRRGRRRACSCARRIRRSAPVRPPAPPGARVPGAVARWELAARVPAGPALLLSAGSRVRCRPAGPGPGPPGRIRPAGQTRLPRAAGRPPRCSRSLTVSIPPSRTPRSKARSSRLTTGASRYRPAMLKSAMEKIIESEKSMIAPRSIVAPMTMNTQKTTLKMSSAAGLSPKRYPTALAP